MEVRTTTEHGADPGATLVRRALDGTKLGEMIGGDRRKAIRMMGIIY